MRLRLRHSLIRPDNTIELDPQRRGPWLSKSQCIGSVIVVCLGLYLGTVAQRPYARAQRLHAESDKALAKALRLEKDNGQIKVDVQRLQNSQGVEHLARGYGYVLPGEHRVTFKGKPEN